MVEWRYRGVVQDSDEEGEEFDSLRTSSSLDELAVSNGAQLDSSKQRCPQKDTLISSAIQYDNIVPPQALTKATSGFEHDELDELQDDLPVFSTSPKLTTSEAVFGSDGILPERGTSTHEEERDIFDVPSSPLSEPPHTPRHRLEASLPTSTPLTVRLEPVVVVPCRTPIEHSDSSPRTETRSGPYSRQLRQRNPIQLHPYLLENEQYRQTLRARGLRPVTLANEELRTGGEAAETQNKDDSQYSQSPHSSPLLGASSQTSHSLSIIHAADNGDELPDLDALMRVNAHTGTDQVSGPAKRTTGVIKPMALAGGMAQGGALPSRKLLNSSRLSENTLGINDPLFDVPVSPQETPRPKNRRYRKFRMPKNFDDIREASQLPSQKPSSEINRVLDHFLRLDTDTDSDSQAEGQLPVNLRTPARNLRTEERTHLRSVLTQNTIDIVSSESSTDSEVERARVARQARKFRGVLPASYIRVSEQGRTKRARSIHEEPEPVLFSPQTDVPRRGVAKRVEGLHHSIAHSKVSSPTRLAIEISDESDGIVELDQMHLEPPEKASRVARHVALQNQFIDIEEDDWIDPMLPDSSRNRNSTITKRKRQIRLTESFHPLKRRAIDGPRHKQTASSPRRSKGPILYKPSRTRSGAPKRSVLDAPSLSSLSQKPDFLKVAMRQARSRPDKGRHSPSRKVISMQSQIHGVEVDATFRAWKQGQIKRAKEHQLTKRPSKVLTNRQPLVARSYNPQIVRKAAVLRPRSGFGASTIGPQPPAGAKEIPGTFPIHPENSNLKREAQRCSKATHEQQSKQAKLSFLMPQKLLVRSRPGQLEGAVSSSELSPEPELMQNTLGALDFVEGGNQPLHNPLLARYLAEDEFVLPQHSTRSILSDRAKLGPQLADVVVIRRVRKRPPKWLNISAINVHQIQDEDTFLDEVSEVPAAAMATMPVEGLGSLGTIYPTTFDVDPFALGTYFHDTTFIGSGKLRKALNPVLRDMDESCGSMDIHHGGKRLACSSWSAEVASLINEVLSAVTTPQSDDICSSLQSVLEYYVEKLSFADPVDRQLCVVFTAQALHRAFEVPLHGGNAAQVSRILMFGTILAHRVVRIADHSLVPGHDQVSIQSIVARLGREMFIHLKKSYHDLKRLLSELRLPTRQERGIRTSDSTAEAIVALFQLNDTTVNNVFDFWTAFNDIAVESLRQDCFMVADFEFVWHRVFLVLPYHEFDLDGVMERGKRFKCPTDNWTLIKTLLERLYVAHDHIDSRQILSMNSYFRTILLRCHHLIRQWGWQRGEVVLGSIFDYFGRRGFGLLPHEEVSGSPAFLDTLDEYSHATIEPSDRSFHIFLKMLRTSLIGMRETHTAKKLSNIAWRFIPNHNRSHNKEEALNQNDLDSLRNQHDLLVVLYSSLPEASRPNLKLIRKLVDIGNSHSEVCRLNVRAWAQLVNFHLSGHDSSSAMEPFVAWFNDIVVQLIHQHQLARTEGESVAEATRKDRLNSMTNDRIESMIRRNQIQIEGVLVTLLGALKDALQEARNVAAATALLKACSLSRVLQIFDPNQIRLNNVVGLALEVYRAFLIFIDRQSVIIAEPIQQNSEESQEYGDWPDEMDLDDLGNGQTSSDAAIFEPIWTLLSNCFGGDKPIAENFLTKLVTIWVEVARNLVKIGHRDWNYYLGQHSPGSWAQLRKTDTARQYLPYYLSLVIEGSPISLESDSIGFMSAWLVSLVERDANLKFQHRLTAALLNAGGSHPLLKNLPFARSTTTKKFEITMEVLRQRRVGVLSSVLENMRDTYDDALIRSGDGTHVRQDYTNILKYVMHAMKSNYQELQLGTSLRGAYVDFVQKLVEFMQQYTVEICPVDKFFVDSAAFPLPTTDPTYVVGRLKGYGRKLTDAKTVKKLVIFVQTVCERAALEGQQEYLVDQLARSVDGSFEKDTTQASLRRVIFTAILPAYLDATFASACGWILTLPLLEAVKIMSRKLIFNFNLNKATDVQTLFETCNITLGAIASATVSLTADGDFWPEPATLKTLAVIYDICTAMMTPLNYCVRFIRTHRGAVHQNTTFLLALAQRLGTQLAPRASEATTGYEKEEAAAAAAATATAEEQQLRAPFRETRAFCSRELRETLKCNWAKHGGGYSVMRGNTRREVAVDVGVWEQERDVVVQAVDAFVEAAKGCMFLMRERGGRGGRGGGERLARQRRGRAELWV